MEQLVALLLMHFEVGVRAHWRTRSYAEHQALGQFYEALPGFADSLVECYQGCEGKLLKIPSLSPPASAGDSEKFIRDGLEKIRAARKDFEEYPELQNQIDEIATHYQRTLYMLRFLD